MPDLVSELAGAAEALWLARLADANHYFAARPIGGHRWAAIHHFAFTDAILVGDMFDDWGYADRWCFERGPLALYALDEWESREFEGEPIGWHRHPDSGRRRPGGDPTREYINP